MLAYEAIIDGNWEKALANFERNRNQRDCYSKWKGSSAYIMVEACERPGCPREVYEYLMTSGGPNMFRTRRCVNPGGIGAMTPICVSAEKGNIIAIRVFLETKYYMENQGKLD
jgi:hypothetical protein